MAKDFANRRKTRSKRKTASKKRSGFSFGSFIAGMIVGVGLFLVTAYAPELFSRNSPLAPPTSITDAEGTSAAPPETGQVNPQDSDLEFVFRDILTEDSPAPDISAYEPITPPNPPAPANEGRDSQPNATTSPANSHNQYLLQSGSFQILADAERRRGELLLMNLPANVVEAEIDDNIWYRVVVGPFRDRSSANRVVTALRERQIAAIWLARPATN